MMTYQRETMTAVLGEIQPLLERHWREIAYFQDIPLEPDYGGYERAEAANRLRIFTARRDGALVGYAIFFLGNLHYKSARIATQDILFLVPECRGFPGYRLIRFSDQQLKAEGVEVTYHHVKVAHDFGPLLVHMGYQAVDTIYARRH